MGESYQNEVLVKTHCGDVPKCPTDSSTDEYDRCITYLRGRPEELQEAMNNPCHHPAGALFRWCHPNPKLIDDTINPDAPFDAVKDWGVIDCGDIMMIKYEGYVAYGGDGKPCEYLTQLIRWDKRIPTARNVSLDNLDIFAIWQRGLDNLYWRYDGNA